MPQFGFLFVLQALRSINLIIITWENQQIDYPSCGPDMPEFEPRGCPRGASFSWYEFLAYQVHNLDNQFVDFPM
jgi:hypothetical protein